MATQANTLVRIERDGVQKTVSEADYKHKKMASLQGQTYEAAGFKVVSYEDGTPYGEDAKPTDYAINKNTASAIGEGGTSATTIDGTKADDSMLAATGVTLAEPTTSRARSVSHTPASASESTSESTESA
jgi:hypothetical protein